MQRALRWSVPRGSRTLFASRNYSRNVGDYDAPIALVASGIECDFSVFLFLVSAFFYLFIYDVNNSQYTIYIYDDMVDRYNNHDIIIKI